MATNNTKSAKRRHRPLLSLAASVIMNRLGYRFQDSPTPAQVREAFLAGKLIMGPGGPCGLGQKTLDEFLRFAYPKSKGALKCHGMGIGHRILQAIGCPNKQVTKFSIHFDINQVVRVQLEYIGGAELENIPRILSAYQLVETGPRRRQSKIQP
jgi:hypothetical protein